MQIEYAIAKKTCVIQRILFCEDDSDSSLHWFCTDWSPLESSLVFLCDNNRLSPNTVSYSFAKKMSPPRSPELPIYTLELPAHLLFFSCAMLRSSSGSLHALEIVAVIPTRCLFLLRIPRSAKIIVVVGKQGQSTAALHFILKAMRFVVILIPSGSEALQCSFSMC